MVVTFDVLKLLKLISSREEHKSNIYEVSFTDDESKCDKSIYVIATALGSSSSYAEKKRFKEVISSEKCISTAVFALIVNSVVGSTIILLFLIYIIFLIYLKLFFL